MSKYRCPVCGASHTEQPQTCRLCGQYLGSRLTGPAQPSQVRTTTRQRKGVIDIALIAILGVVAIGVIFVVLGLTGSNSFVENIRDRIPGLAAPKADGWETIDDADGGFIAEMPDTAIDSQAPFAQSETGRLEQWVADLGPETELSISYAQLAAPPTDDDWRGYLALLATAYGQSMFAEADQIEDQMYRGLPAVTTTIDNLEMVDSNGETQPATAKAWLILRGDRLYIIQSKSVYDDHPNFGRLANGLQFT